MNRKLFLLIVLAVLFFTTRVHAQGGEPPVPAEPQSDVYVLDTLGWLDESQEGMINVIARKLDAEGTAQIYVATLDDCGSDKTQYKRDIFAAWKVGTEKTSGGLLILACWYGGDTSRRSIEVRTDEKMQSVVSDALSAKTAEDNFVPAFKENEPGVGLVKMVVAFDKVIRGEKPAEIPLSLIVIGTMAGTILLIVLAAIDWKRLRNGEGFGWVSGEGSGSGGEYYGGGDGGGGGGDGGGSSTGF